MKYIIPAKDCTERVPSKNWRHFHDGRNLVERTIWKLWSAGVSHKDIYVSCENSKRLTELTNRYHSINCILRDLELCGNGVSLTDWMQGICAQVPGDDDIAWCQVCDPLFNEYAECFKLWQDVSVSTMHYDSLTVRYKTRQYLMDVHGNPIGWSFGSHHTPSQHLPSMCLMPFTLSILTRKCIESVGYHVGRVPLWYDAKGKCLDIDTEFDFKVAQAYVQTLDKSASACTQGS
jgi:CMP-N-acetylneuraminic acid synthetase